MNNNKDICVALAAEPPAPGPTINDIWELCEDHEFHLGEGFDDEASAEIMLQIIRVALTRWGNQPPAPAPAADGEREELAQWLERIGDDYDDLYRLPSALIRPKLARAAALLRQLPPEGVEAIRYCVEEDGAVIQRTSRVPESWAIRAGSSCMSTTGEWDIEPMPSERTDEWLTNHRWPSAAAAWAALQQARRQEVGDE